MAQSSFDPMALVKAMGAQTDPYSWAKDYSKSVDNKNNLMAELGNKMEIAEMNKDAQIEAANIRAKAVGSGRKSDLELKDFFARRRDKERFDRSHEVSDAAAIHSANAQGIPNYTDSVIASLLATSNVHREAMNSGRLRRISKGVWILDNPAKPYQYNIPRNLAVPQMPVERPEGDTGQDTRDDADFYNERQL